MRRRAAAIGYPRRPPVHESPSRSLSQWSRPVAPARYSAAAGRGVTRRARRRLLGGEARLSGAARSASPDLRLLAFLKACGQASLLQPRGFDRQRRLRHRRPQRHHHPEPSHRRRQRHPSSCGQFSMNAHSIGARPHEWRPLGLSPPPSVSGRTPLANPRLSSGTPRADRYRSDRSRPSTSTIGTGVAIVTRSSRFFSKKLIRKIG